MSRRHRGGADRGARREAVRLGVTTAEPVVRIAGDSAPIAELLALNEGVLEAVYPSRTAADPAEVPVLSAPSRSPDGSQGRVWPVPKVLHPRIPRHQLRI